MKETKTININIGGWTFRILFIILFVLKVCGIGMVAYWSWWWVFAPIWIPWGLVSLWAVILFAISMIEASKTGRK